MTTTEILHDLRLISLDTVGSTNDEARRLAQEGAPDGTLVRARRQTAGRGRLGRTWISDPGNLYFSLVLRPGCPLDRAGQIGFVVANAVVEAVATALPEGIPVGCKWPNDVLVAGRKVSGILLESETDGDGRLSCLVAGVGINIASHPDDVRFPATSLVACGAGAGISPDGVLATFGNRFQAGYAVWAHDGFEPVRRAWLARAIGRGSAIQARLANATVDGVFEDMDDGGALIIRRADGARVTVTAGDIHFPEAPTDSAGE